ncbi:MAG: class IV adenylate cyclase [Phycisphaerales bacterium]
MHNVEYKAELRDPPLGRAIARRLGATLAAELAQEDTYYRVPSGRLKRREIVSTDGTREIEYIFYDRPDLTTPRLSHYVIYDEPTARERFGTRSLPIDIVVTKRREVFLTGPVRIHLDEVRSLGSFLEFEAVVSRDHPVRRCHELVADLREAFRPATGEPIAVGYADLLRMERDFVAQPSEDGRSGLDSSG